MTTDDIIEAHRYSINQSKIIKDKKCGCFYCLKIFSPKEVADWIEDTSPYCNCDSILLSIDAIIGESSCFPITEEFLLKMKNYWF